jgi:hypothetical protein
MRTATWNVDTLYRAGGVSALVTDRYKKRDASLKKTSKHRVDWEKIFMD